MAIGRFPARLPRQGGVGPPPAWTQGPAGGHGGPGKATPAGGGPRRADHVVCNMGGYTALKTGSLKSFKTAKFLVNTE